MSIFVPNNSGTVTFTNGDTAIAGTGTLFKSYRAGSVISIPGIGEMQLAEDPTSDTVAVGTVAWQGATAEDEAFQYLPRNEEGVFTDKLTQLLSDLGNGNMQALAGLALSAGKVMTATGPGALGLVDRQEFISGVRFDARVADEPGLATYATKPGPTADAPGFTVLVEAYGAPPRTVLVSKASDASGDWTGPAYVEGDVGEKGWTPLTIRAEDGERQVIQLSGYIGGEGDAPTANLGRYLKADGTWTATIGEALDVRGASFNWVAGGYNGANAYAKRDALRDQGASWIALQAVPPGNPPPTLPATSNAYWDLMAEPGLDGEGLVNGISAGTNIAVDATDPTNPVVSAPSGAAGRSVFPVYIEQFLTAFHGRGILTAETINVTTEQSITGSSAAGATTVGVTTGSDFDVGGNVVIKHDNGRYEPYFVRGISSNKAEVINDYSGDVANLFRILQRHYPQFMETLKFQLSGRREFERLKASNPATLTDLERAGRFLYLQRLAFGGKVAGRNFGVDVSGSAGFNIITLAPQLDAIHQRLAGVTIENLRWQDFLTRYDRPGTLFYLDPPYWGSEDDYGKAMFGREEFEEMAGRLRGLKGRFILSINDVPEIREVFAGFEQAEAKTTYGVQGGGASARELVITG